MYWSGLTLANARILVCEPCLDIPNEQLRTIVLPPDPPPVPNARPAQWASESAEAQTVPGDDPDTSGLLLEGLAAGFLLLEGSQSGQILLEGA